MLELLFSSRSRARLIILFFSVPGQEYWLREAARAVDMNINAVRREMLRLEEVGILTGVKRGNQRVFQTNTSHPFFPELLSMVQKECFQDHQNSSLKIPEAAFLIGRGEISGDEGGDDHCGDRGFRQEDAAMRSRRGLCYRVE